jgi:hypothetical protein
MGDGVPRRRNDWRLEREVFDETLPEIFVSGFCAAARHVAAGGLRAESDGHVSETRGLSFERRI